MTHTHARRRPLLLLALSTALLVGCDKNITDNDIEFIDISELRVLVDSSTPGSRSLLLIDPRSEASFTAQRLPGAVNIQLPQIDPEGDEDPALQPYANLVVYGENPSSAPARAMTKRLLSAGFDDVRMYAGGVEEWAAANFPTESGPTENVLMLRRRRQ